MWLVSCTSKPCSRQVPASVPGSLRGQEVGRVPDAYVCPEGQRPRRIQRSKSEQLCSLGYLTSPYTQFPVVAGFWIVTAHWEISYSKMESRVWHLSLY